MNIETLADVRKLLLRLPQGHQAKTTWRYVAAQLLAAANGADVSEVATPLQMALSMEGLPYRRL